MTSGEDADETGIIVAGISRDKRAYLLDDLSGRHQPHEWAAKAIEAYRKHQADKIVAEVNAGGEMVAATVKVQDANVAFKAVRASRGKVTGAEPYMGAPPSQRLQGFCLSSIRSRSAFGTKRTKSRSRYDV